MVLAAFGLRVTVMVLIFLRNSLACKMIRRGLLIWEDFQGLRRVEEGIELGRVAVLVFNCAFFFLGLDKKRKKRLFDQQTRIRDEPKLRMKNRFGKNRTLSVSSSSNTDTIPPKPKVTKR